MGFWGFDSVADMFDDGGRGGSGSEFSTKSHEDYKKDYEKKHGKPDWNAKEYGDREAQVSNADGKSGPCEMMFNE